MARLKALYMLVNRTADSKVHRAILELPTTEMHVVAVKSLEEGAVVAREFVDDGGVLIELCGGFGYDGARKVCEAVGDRAAVGVVTHQVSNYRPLAEALGGR
jgi:hypothetical protein